MMLVVSCAHPAVPTRAGEGDEVSRARAREGGADV